MFQERLKQIKEQRIASEQLLLDSNIQKFVNFDIEKRLEENEETAEKHLKSLKIGGYVAGSYLLGAVGTVAFGASIIATGGTSSLFAGAMIIGGVSAVTLPILGELLMTSSFIFKDKKSHNLDLVQFELDNLKRTVEESAVNKKTTVTDYFKATKDTLKSEFSKIKNEIKNDYKNMFKPISQDKVLDRIKKIQDSKQDFINSSKLKM